MRQVLFSALLALAAGSVGAAPSKPQARQPSIDRAPDAAHPLSAVDTAAVEKAVKARLKDPDSAKFQLLPIKPGSWYCGRVNAKNTYGGYTGFGPFMILKLDGSKPLDLTPPAIIADDPGSPIWVTTTDTCKKAGYPVDADQ